MARLISRTAGPTAAVAGLALMAGCHAPGNYATMRFAMDRQGAPAAPTAPGAAAPMAAAAALAGAAPLLVTADVVAPDAPSAVPGAAPAADRPSRGGSGGGSGSRGAVPAPAPEAVFEVAHPAAGPGAATVTFHLPGLAAAQRRLLATVADIDHVVITITPATGASASQTIPASALAGGTGSVTFTGLPPTAATATIQAFDAFGQEIGRGTQPVTIDAVNPTLINFAVTLNPTYVPPTTTVNANVTIVDGPVIVGTPPPGTVVRPGQRLAEIKGLGNPQKVVFDPAGTTAWVPSFNNKLFALDLQGKVKGSYAYAVSGSTTSLLPVEVAFDPGGGMWVANYGGSSVSEVNPATGKITKTFTTGKNPVGIEFVGGIMHVLSHPLDVIQRFTTAGAPAGLPLPVNPLAGPPKPTTHMPVRMRASAADEFWIANMKTDTVSRLTAAGLPLANIVVGDEPEGLAFGPSNDVWVTNNRANTIMRIDMATNTVTGTYAVGARPRGVALDRNNHLWIACSEANEVWRMSTAGVILGKYPTAKDPRDVTIDPAGAAWVACGAGGAVLKFAP